MRRAPQRAAPPPSLAADSRPGIVAATMRDDGSSKSEPSERLCGVKYMYVANRAAAGSLSMKGPGRNQALASWRL